MGDRNNPIKFGPEWLRNMSRERSAARTNLQNAAAGAGTSGPGPSGATGGPSTSTASGTNANDQNKAPTSKVLLARLRYGREEMLALYDCSSEAPPELKNIDTLYQPRGKQPVALNNTFDDDLRDTLRSAPPIGNLTSGDRERFSIGRGAGRGVINEGRGRGRPSYVHRQPTVGRGGGLWHTSNPRAPGYSLGPDEEGASSRPWASTNTTNRNSGDQTEWTSKTYRSKRQGATTNWRQPQARDDGEEWRSSDPARNRQLDKWEWGAPPSWSSNRRNWVGGDSQNDENLPEWAAENADCGGTFDSSGAFHGYSNDDTNIPKHQDSTHPLTRSHTHGSFPRSKVVDEGSEEWWASEKAKKLSPKRFDASDIKFKKQAGIGMGESSSNQNSTTKNNSESSAPPSTPDKNEPQSATPESPDSSYLQDDEKYNKKNYKTKFGESKTFDAMMRSNLDMEDTNDERGNFQSVIINSNNSLRQKHQHIVPAVNDATKKLQNLKLTKPDMELTSHKSPEDLQDNILRSTLEDLELLSSSSSANSLLNLASSSLSSNILPQSQKSNIQMSNSVLPNHGMNMDMHINSQGLQSMQPGHPSPNLQPDLPSSMQASGMSSGHPNIQSSLMQSNVHSSNMSSGIPSAALSSSRMPSVGLPSPRMQLGMQSPGMLQDPGVPTPGMQQVVGITNSALNASLGLPIGPGPNITMPMQLPQQVMPSGGNNMSGTLGASNLLGSQGPGNLPGFQNTSGITGMTNNVGNSSRFLGQNSSNQSLSSTNDMPMSNHSGQSNMFPMHGLQHSSSQSSFGGNSIYGNNGPNLTEQWYYEDPDRNIQGPFSSKDMYNWYRAGFFSPSLMVRRACETMMRPLGTYGPMVPFSQRDNILSSFPLSGGYDSRPQGHDNILNTQSSLGLDDSLWSQPGSSNMSWMQQPLGAEARVNNLPVFFWDQQPSAIASNSLLPEEITKEMKTEDQILAQLRATQNIGQPSIPFIGDQSVNSSASIKTNDCFTAAINATPNLEELHKLIQKDTLTGNQTAVEVENSEAQQKQEKAARVESSSSDTSVTKPIQAKATDKAAKLVKENDKSAKNKENSTAKSKSKKTKDDKKDDAEAKTKEDEVVNVEKRSQESSPSKKKEEKLNKKDLEREKKEWLKEGFTIVKGAEKSTTKDNKKKVEEARAVEEAERKKKEEEKLAAEEDKKRKQVETVKKQQEQQSQQRQTEPVTKKAPWSAVANQTLQATTREGPTLAEIQRLEREKKLEQMKEQQQMMQIIAQQQAAALAREQEMQAGLGWAKKKANNTNNPGQSLAEIQAEARKQAAAAAAAATAAAAAAAIEEAQASSPPQTNHIPWGNTPNGGLTYGFWDPQPNQPSKPEKIPEQPKPAEPKAKKKPTLIMPPKKETSPAVEFEAWCTTVLASWSSKIDVPTFVGFLKDIESPYEVKDYVKCYLGDTKDSGDFARQFLERRSKLLRVGMVTPSDDLCSPAIAVTPRTASGSDFQELKGKGKKTKKNKMLKVDARILGFSVTAAEDRINVGDIDTV